jgi:predicted transport protein
MYLKKKYRGVHSDRYGREPLEKLFAELWQEENQKNVNSDHTTLDWILTTDEHNVGFSSKRDYEVASTIIQWLGSAVGQGFLRDVAQEARKKNIDFPAYTMMVCVEIRKRRLKCHFIAK